MTQQYIEIVTSYGMKLVFVHKSTFILRKITKTAATRAALFDSQYAPSHLSAGASHHTPLGERTARSRAVFRGLLLKGVEFVLCPMKKTEKLAPVFVEIKFNNAYMGQTDKQYNYTRCSTLPGSRYTSIITILLKYQIQRSVLPV